MSELDTLYKKAITANEAKRFAELETIIREGEKTFIAVGNALREIDEKRLYRKEFRTFSAYLKHRWGKSKSWGYGQIAAANVVKNVHDRGQNGQAIVPANVEQARALSSVPDDRQSAIWAEVLHHAKDGDITGKLVENVVKAAGFTVPKGGSFDVRGSSASSEYKTPEKFLEAVRWVFDDQIDLDPATMTDNPTKARAFYTKADDGLKKSWKADNLFLNPPWAKADGMGPRPWVERFVKSYKAQDFDEAILVCPASIDTQWWDFVSSYTWCGPKGRVHYGDGPAQFPTAFVYVGPTARRFIEKFGEFGPVYQRIG